MKMKIAIVVLLTAISVSGWGQCATSSMPTSNCASYGDEIDAFTLNGIAATGVTGCSTNGYQTFLSPIWSLTVGNTYTFSASLGNGSWSEGLAIWIDLNNDGTYASTEMVFSGTPGTSVSGSITIPFSAAIANGVHMRLRCEYNYSIQATEACSTLNSVGEGETQDFFINIVCPAAPVLSTASTNTYICLGQSTTFTASGASNYTWTGGSTNTVVTFTPGTTTSYTLFGAVGACAGATAQIVKTISVTNVPLPLTTTVTSTVVCQGSAVSASVSGASSYTWLPANSNGSTAVLSPQAPTVYTVIGYNGSGCPGASMISLSVSPIPTIQVNVSTGTICAGQSVTVTVSGANSYSWANSSFTGTMQVLTPTSNLLVTVTGTVNSCSSTSNNIVLVNQPPVVNITATQTLACVNSPITLAASGAPSYTWVNGPNTSTYQVSPMSTTVYTLLGSSTSNTCVGMTTSTITVLDPTITIAATSSSVCMNGAITMTASGADTYVWNNVSNFNPFTLSGLTSAQVVTVTGDVTVDGVTCQGTKMFNIGVHPNPNITASATRTSMCVKENNSIVAGGGTVYAWSNSTNTSNTYTFTSALSVPYNVTVTGTDANGCSNSTVVTVTVRSCAGISEQTAGLGFSVYPNPNNGDFMLESGGRTTIRMINQLGQVVRTIHITDEPAQVRASDLPAGVYYLAGPDGTVVSGGKIIITK